jgi:hypothetical protein
MILSGWKLRRMLELAENKTAAWRDGFLSELFGYDSARFEIQDEMYNRQFYQGRKDARNIKRKKNKKNTRP